MRKQLPKTTNENKENEIELSLERHKKVTSTSSRIRIVILFSQTITSLNSGWTQNGGSQPLQKRERKI